MPRQLVLRSRQHPFNKALKEMGLAHVTELPARRAGTGPEKPVRGDHETRGKWGITPKGYVVLHTDEADGCRPDEIWYGRCPEAELDQAVIARLCPKGRDDEKIRLIIGDELAFNNDQLFDRIRRPYSDCGGKIILPDVSQVKFQIEDAEELEVK